MSVRVISAAAVVAILIACSTQGTGVPAAPAPQAGGGTGVAANTPQPTAAPATIPAAAPAGTPPAGAAPQGGPPGGFPRGRQPLTPEQRAARRDSAAAVRTATIAELSRRIAGYETRRAEEEFTNIRVLKDTTAANLLKVMDYYGRSLGVGCTYCHVAGDKWDDDSKDEKRSTRVMIDMVNLINRQGLSKMEPNRNGQTPTINCVTCHRGNTRPGTALLP